MKTLNCSSPDVLLLILVSFLRSITTIYCTESVKLDEVVEQYCSGETFRPRCTGGRNDIVMLLNARFGRMKFGRCIEEEPDFATMMDNPRFLGCSADVKPILDRFCSGQPECDVRITNQNFQGVRPCLTGLQMYLEASYTCIRVADENRHCTVTLTTESQHIVGGGKSRALHSSIDCGDETQPWLVEAMAGQRIAVSLINIGQQTENQSIDASRISTCRPQIGYIIDRNSRRNITLCGHQYPTDGINLAEKFSGRTVYTSTSNRLQIVANDDVDAKFIIRLEAVGCSDLAPPSNNAWLKRVDDEITIGCYMSRQSWHLKCINGVWTGTVGSCRQIDVNDRAASADENQQLLNDRESVNNRTSTAEVAALAAVASAGIAVCCLVICIGVFGLHRLHKQEDMKNSRAWRNTFENTENRERLCLKADDGNKINTTGERIEFCREI